MSIVHGEWTLRLPLVVAPRYTSGIPLPRASSGNGIGHDTDQVPDASCVTPPTWLPGFASPIDLRLVVDIEVGQLACAPDWATQLKSSLHTALVKVDAGRAGCCRVELLPAELINRDFILRGQVLDQQASSSVVCETAPGQETASHQSQGTGETTFAITIVPPRKNTSIPRQVGATHVLVSRSMAKTSTIYLIDGRVVNRDQVPRRLWLPILNRLKLLAQLDIANLESFQTGAFKTFLRTQEVELTVYTARDSFLIELQRAKELSTIPPEVEQWLNEQRASTP